MIQSFFYYIFNPYGDKKEEDFVDNLETYKEDIVAFFEALIAWVKALIAKINEDNAATE